MKKFIRIGGITLVILVVLVIILLKVIGTKDIPVEELKAKYANNASKFMPLEGMPVHYRDEGNSDDSVPLVLIHSTSSSLLTWDSCASLLKGTHRVIRFDLPGFGLTGPAPDNDYSVERYVTFLHDFLGQLKINHCYIAGNSTGGAVAWEYAAAYPEQVSKLIIIDALGYPSKNENVALAFKLGKIPVVNKLLTILTPPSVVKQSLLEAYGDGSKVTDKLVNQYLELTCREGNRGAFVARINQKVEDKSALIKTIKTPTLIIWGGKDKLVPIEDAYMFQKDLQSDTLVVLKNEGHMAMEESPELVAPLIKGFIEK